MRHLFIRSGMCATHRVIPIAAVYIIISVRNDVLVFQCLVN